jgi:hypothetical protein
MLATDHHATNSTMLARVPRRSAMRPETRYAMV